MLRELLLSSSQVTCKADHMLWKSAYGIRDAKKKKSVALTILGAPYQGKWSNIERIYESAIKIKLQIGI
jgi:hypothetical protein